MLVLKRLAALAATVTPGLLIGGAAIAGSGQPSPWQLGFQQAATPVMENIVWFHDFLLWLIVAITIFVLALLLIVMVRFNSRANPTPSRTTHNTLLEVMWTLVPVIILVAIAVPSFKLLFLELTIPQADLTVKAQVRNDSDTAVTAGVTGTVAGVTLTRSVPLAAHQTRTVAFPPADTPGLHLTSPKVWWPAGMGGQPLYDLDLTASVAGTASDTAQESFGVRDVRAVEQFVRGQQRSADVNDQLNQVRPDYGCDAAFEGVDQSQHAHDDD